MIRFTVVWTHEAENELAEIWNQASDRASVTSAAATIDAELAVDAAAKGEQLSEGLRKLRVLPLIAIFSANQEDRLVEIATVRYRPPHGSLSSGSGPGNR